MIFDRDWFENTEPPQHLAALEELTSIVAGARALLQRHYVVDPRGTHPSRPGRDLLSRMDAVLTPE